VLVGLAVVVAVRDRGQLLRIAAVIAASGAIQGFYGAAEYLSGHQHILGYPKTYFLDSATGTFINRNHFAAYLAMTLPFAVALVLDAYRRWSIARAERGTAFFFDGSAVGIVAGTTATSIIWTGIVLSDSRAGFAVSLVAVAVVLFSVSSRHARILIVLAIVVPTLLLLGQEIRAPAERFAAPVDNLASVGGRVPVWRATLGIVADYQPFGSGYGTFGAVFPLYRPPEIEKRWDHVHNDWLESASDGGVVVTLAMFAVLWISLRRMDAASQQPAPDALRAGVTASLTAIAIHSLVDFPLRIPAVALLCATVVGLSCVAGPGGGERGMAEPRPLRSIR
jgi:O-antigen ligase